MVTPYTLDAQRRWDRGEFKVQVLLPTNTRPVAFCEGTDEDIAELAAIAEEEGTDLPTIHRKYLKTGREIWTMGEPPVLDEDPDDF